MEIRRQEDAKAAAASATADFADEAKDCYVCWDDPWGVPPNIQR